MNSYDLGYAVQLDLSKGNDLGTTAESEQILLSFLMLVEIDSEFLFCQYLVFVVTYRLILKPSIYITSTTPNPAVY